MMTSAAMLRSKPNGGPREYHLEAELLHEFRRHGSQFPAYTSIVAAGANASEIDAGATERRVVGHRDPRATLRRHARSAHTAAAGTDDEQVELTTTHVHAPSDTHTENAATSIASRRLVSPEPCPRLARPAR